MQSNLFLNDDRRGDNIKSFSFLQTDYNYEEDDIKTFIKNKRGKIDYRYDSFIASLLASVEDQFSLPSNVNIITWNYDCQFELAFKQFSGLKLFDIQKELGVYPLLKEKDEPIYWQEIKNNKFKILHINGQAHFYRKINGEYSSCLDYEQIIEQNLETTINSIDKSDIAFSWERNSNSLHNPEVSKVIDEAIRIMNHAKIIVIIGYSFPYFNREVDQQLFGNLGGVDKIYIQDLYGERIKEHILTVYGKIDSDRIKVQDDVSQFLLPPEMG